MDSMLAELTPVQQVSLLGVRLRALDARSDIPILGDTLSAEVAAAIGLDHGGPKIPRSVVLVHAVRSKALDNVVRQFTARHPNAVVLDLGCGLDPRMQRCDPPPGVDWYDVDFPAVTRLREWCVPDRAHLIGVDVTSQGWLDDLPQERPTVIVTDGLMALVTGAAFTAVARADGALRDRRIRIQRLQSARDAQQSAHPWPAEYANRG